MYVHGMWKRRKNHQFCDFNKLLIGKVPCLVPKESLCYPVYTYYLLKDNLSRVAIFLFHSDLVETHFYVEAE